MNKCHKFAMQILVAMAVVLILVGMAANTIATSINIDNHFAYGANIGWLDARGDVANGAVIGLFYSTGYLYGANVGWISLGSGTPANGHTYANNSASDWGVNHVGHGHLRGFAYGANIGWLNFETNGNPRVDLLTGNLDGYVWGANVGWISLSNAQAFVQTDFLDLGPDTDGDGIPDAWEMKQVGNLDDLGPYPDDFDGDGYPDLFEYYADTNPAKDDSYLRITDLDRSNPTNLVTWTVEPTRVYRLEVAESITNGTVWVDSGYDIIAPDASPTLTRDVVETNAPHQFFRAIAIVPLQP